MCSGLQMTRLLDVTGDLRYTFVMNNNIFNKRKLRSINELMMRRKTYFAKIVVRKFFSASRKIYIYIFFCHLYLALYTHSTANLLQDKYTSDYSHKHIIILFNVWPNSKHVLPTVDSIAGQSVHNIHRAHGIGGRQWCSPTHQQHCTPTTQSRIVPYVYKTRLHHRYPLATMLVFAERVVGAKMISARERRERMQVGMMHGDMVRLITEGWERVFHVWCFCIFFIYSLPNNRHCRWGQMIAATPTMNAADTNVTTESNNQYTWWYFQRYCRTEKTCTNEKSPKFALKLSKTICFFCTQRTKRFTKHYSTYNSNQYYILHAQ